MNIRFSTLVWMFVMTAAAFGLYALKYKVQSIQQQVASASNQLAQEREALHVLSVEWTYLNRSERLGKLSKQHLALVPVTGQAMSVTMASLPSLNAEPLDNRAIQPAQYVASRTVGEGFDAE